jgi:hypothetical protein
LLFMAADRGLPTLLAFRPFAAYRAAVKSRLAQTTFALVALVSTPALARPWPESSPHPRITTRLGSWLLARAHNDSDAAAHHAWQGALRFDDQGRVEVEIEVAKPDDADTVLDAWFTDFGGRIALRGLDRLDAWMPPAALAPLLDRHPTLLAAREPMRPVPTVGPAMSEGAVNLHTPQVQCLGAYGNGATVAVLDGGFAGIDDAFKKGELPGLVQTAPAGAGSHGTMCAEVVQDVAPGAKILPVITGTFTAAQKFAKDVADGKLKVDVVSHSVIWFGHSFGGVDGAACAVVNLVQQHGVAWVNASGNSGGGRFHMGVWNDKDGDGKHDFAVGGERLTFLHHGGEAQLLLDWDDYAARKTDLDLLLERKDGDKWVAVDESNYPQGKGVPPMEAVKVAQGGVYGLTVSSNKPVPKGMRFRVVNLGFGSSGSFSVWHSAGNVYDPASCPGALTVGAAHWSQWDKGPLVDYSSHGPLPDGRQKPEVVAPTGVKTSLGDFHGTSAACPHAAGLVAVYAAAEKLPATEVVAELAHDASPVQGVPAMDDAWGRGRIRPVGAHLGWACDAAVSPPFDATCLTTCGTVGKTSCGQQCRFGECAPPFESCNGKDDDCDGFADEGLFKCVWPPPVDAGPAEVEAAAVAAPDVAKPAPDVQPAPAAKADSGCTAASTPALAPWSFAVVAALAFTRRRRSR